MSKPTLYAVFVAGLFGGGEMFGDEPGKNAADNEQVERLEDFTVVAGRMPTGSSPGAILNTVEVLSTPGATADINRALQTFPGVQQVDEGNALFVRGGDSFETKTLVNGICYPAATRINAPTGSFSGTLDPMQTRSITFLNGGLGAPYGNVLSGVVDLATRGAPTSSSATINLGLGAVGATGNVALGKGAGFRAAAVRNSVAPIVGLNGSSHDYEEKPNGRDLSVATGFGYRPGGEIRAYLLDQENRLGLRIDLPEIRGLYRARFHSSLGTLSWNDQFGNWCWGVNAGSSRLSRDEVTPLGNISTVNSQRQFSASVTYDLAGRIALTGGFDGAQADFSLSKSRTDDGVFRSFRRGLAETRTGAFLQADGVVVRHLRAILGGRVDHSNLAKETTVDPRVTLAWDPKSDLGLSLAGGSYHQVPDGFYFLDADGGWFRRPAMRAQDVVAALEHRGEAQTLRVEVYQKHYGALAQMDRNHLPVARSGRGAAHGADVFLKTALPGDVAGRLTYSYVEAERTDPSTGAMAAAPWDVTHSVSLVVERNVLNWHASLGWRYATGRPITPIVGGRPDGTGGWTPVYGEPYSDRVRTLQRVDVLVYRVWFVKPGLGITTYVSINNLFNHANVYSRSYSDDYSRWWNAPSLFNRVLYFGAMFNFN